jgi:hypothetical protein
MQEQVSRRTTIITVNAKASRAVDAGKKELKVFSSSDTSLPPPGRGLSTEFFYFLFLEF